MSEEQGSREVSITFERSQSAVSVPVNGVWGGISNDLSVWAAFYHERGALPNYITLEVDKHGRGDPNKGDRVARGDVTREVQVTMQMSPESAISIGNWLIQKGKDAVKERESRK